MARIEERSGGDGVEGVEGDAEVFDDLDFYQVLLRDVIDSRTGADGKSMGIFWMKFVDFGVDRWGRLDSPSAPQKGQKGRRHQGI